MPANIESMFSVREMPWHRQGQVLTDYPGTWTAARTLAGLDWEPVTEPVYAAVGINEDGTPHYAPIEGWKRISRSDTGTTLSLNRDTYRLIDHTEMGEIIEAVLAQPNVKWETAGVLDEGRAVWCLAKLDEPIELPGDDSLTLPYLAITNRHDGSGACALRATAVRIVCANTFRAAELEGSGHGATFAFVHKGRWRDRIDEAPPSRHRRPPGDPPLPAARPRPARHPHHSPAAGAVHHPVPAHATRRAGQRPGRRQHRGGPPSPAAHLRIPHHRTGRRHRLRPHPGRRRVPRPRPPGPHLGDPAQPHPHARRTTQNQGTDPRA